MFVRVGFFSSLLFFSLLVLLLLFFFSFQHGNSPRMIYRNHANLRDTFGQHRIFECMRKWEMERKRAGEWVWASEHFHHHYVAIGQYFAENGLKLWVILCHYSSSGSGNVGESERAREKILCCWTLEIMRPHFYSHTKSQPITVPPLEKPTTEKKTKEIKRTKKADMADTYTHTQSKAKIKKCFECSYPCGRS